MNKLAITLAAAIVLAVSPALAGWNGLYIGGNVGGGRGHVSVTDTDGGVAPGPFDYGVTNAMVGVDAGYNWQNGNLVYGVEGDLGYMGSWGAGTIGSSHAGHVQNLTLDSGAYGDITGRVGWGDDSTLFYLKGGLAFFSGSARQTTTAPGYATTGTGTFTGWTAGVGIEHYISPNLSVKAEYQHYGFGGQGGNQTATAYDPKDMTPNGYVFNNSTTASFDVIKVGLNYHF
ncbi:MAG: porin family protein [Patescibacteria group bacterium]|nr:porin family protein [Patescibacteria group bacterium]